MQSLQLIAELRQSSGMKQEFWNEQKKNFNAWIGERENYCVLSNAPLSRHR